MPKVASSATNVLNTIPDQTLPYYKSRASVQSKMHNSTWASVSHMSTKQRRRFRDQKFALSGGEDYLSIQFFFESLLSYAMFHRRVTRSHGSSGVVKSKFQHNLPPRAFGAGVRVVSVVNDIHSFIDQPSHRCSIPRTFELNSS